METHQIGANTVHIDGDLLHTVSGGDITLQMCKDFLLHAERILTDYGRVFLLTDATKMMGLTSEARRYLAEWSKTHQLTASANVVTNPVTRAMLTLATRAMSIVGTPSSPVLFVPTVAAGLAWIAERREEFFRRNPSARLT